MRVVFTSEAAADLESARDWYEEQRKSLGDELTTEAGLAVQAIAANPERWPVIADRYHRFRLRRFPYALVYRMDVDTVVVVAFIHLHRNPRALRKRMR